MKIIEKKYTKHLLKDYYSHKLDRKVSIELLLPDSFSDNTKAYPLLVLNDGQDNKAMKLKKCVEQLVIKQQLPEIIIASVYAENRLHEYGVSLQPDYLGRGELAENYAAFITVELISYLQDNYPIAEGPHAIAGYSLGGLSAFDIAWNYPEIFNRVGVFSGALWWRSVNASSKKFDEKKHRIIHHVVKQTKIKPEIKCWFQAGTKDELSDRNNNGVIDAIDDTLDLMHELKRKGFHPLEDIEYLEIKDGEHNHQTWSKAMPYFLKWAFKD
jgi:enterochelin esterase-like enzyme